MRVRIGSGTAFIAQDCRIGFYQLLLTLTLLFVTWSLFTATVMVHAPNCSHDGGRDPYTEVSTKGFNVESLSAAVLPPSSSSSRKLRRKTATFAASADESRITASMTTNVETKALSTPLSPSTLNENVSSAFVPSVSLEDKTALHDKVNSSFPALSPRFEIEDMFRIEHNRIDAVDPVERCAAFGVKPVKGPPRRLFFGSMLANEHLDVFKIHAVEAHQIYHTVALVESNTTHSGSPRTMRFREGSIEEKWLKHSQLFGNSTQILVDYWLEDMPGLQGMDREVEQRGPIAKLWKQAGMTSQDVAIMADFDEIVSRNFLRSLQVCDFEELRVEGSPSCQAPKMGLHALVFESSPYCISKRNWYHPDVILGQCIEGIGDPTERVQPLRTFQRQWGERTSRYGYYDVHEYPQHVIASGKFPLFSARDIRGIAGIQNGLTEYTDVDDTSNPLVASVAYHLHNWFDDIDTLRHKYGTYAHFDKGWANDPSKTLSKLNREMDMVVRCARNLGNDGAETEYYESHELVDENGIYKHHRPIFFFNASYTKERHPRIQYLIQQDEQTYGTAYDASNSTNTMSKTGSTPAKEADSPPIYDLTIRSLFDANTKEQHKIRGVSSKLLPQMFKLDTSRS